MDKKAYLLLTMSISALVLAGCATTNGTNNTTGATTGGPIRVGQTAQVQRGTNTTQAGVTHTHKGVAHTHPLPEGGLKHSHNFNNGNATNTTVCQPCGSGNRNVVNASATTNTGGNCHMHAGVRHCHPLPAQGTNHSHNRGQSTAAVNNTPVVTAQPAATNNNATYYDYTGSNAGNTSTTASNNAYYNPAPAAKGAVSHSHNGKAHSHKLPAAGINHAHSQGNTSFGNTYNTASSGGRCNTAGGKFYVVKKSEGAYRIGVNHGVKLATLIRLNNLQMPDYGLTPGQCLRLR